MQFFAKLTTLAAYVAVALASTVANVESDLGSITTATQNLDSQIVAFPNSGGSLVAALGIHSSAVSLGSTIDSTTTDVNVSIKLCHDLFYPTHYVPQNVTPQPIALSDAQAILSLVQTLEPIIEKTLTDITAKQAAFAGLPIGGIPALVLQDLENLSTSTQNLETALLAQTPVSRNF